MRTVFKNIEELCEKFLEEKQEVKVKNGLKREEKKKKELMERKEKLIKKHLRVLRSYIGNKVPLEKRKALKVN